MRLITAITSYNRARTHGFLLVTITWLFCSQATIADVDTVNQIGTAFYQWHLKTAPEWATDQGSDIYNNILDSYNITVFQERKMAVDGFLRKLRALNFNDFSKSTKIKYQILKRTLETFSKGFQWKGYGASTPINFLEGIHLEWENVLQAPFKTLEDYENYVERLTSVSQQVEEQIELMRTAIDSGLTNHNVSMISVPEQIRKRVGTTTSPKPILETQYYEPFKDANINNTNISNKAQLRSRAVSVIQSLVLPAMQKLGEFIKQEYLPKCRAGYGVSTLPGGRQYYEACLKWHLSVDTTPEEVHNKGLYEVARISDEMRKVISEHNYNGSLQDFTASLNNDPRMHLGTKERILQGYNHMVFEIVKPTLTSIFTDLPNYPVNIRAMPFDGPGGMYMGTSKDGTRPGTFYVNLRNPSLRTTFDMMALALHEVNPGHHLQTSYKLKAGLSDFRAIEYSHYYRVPYHLPFNTAYSEGWALYSEFLGEELGVYNSSAYELFGRYSSEMFRACRLVVDTGIHVFGWDRVKSVDFMLNYTAMQRDEVETEIDRYITWPGQACAYKIGEIKIKELRNRAKSKLGVKFDVKEFHNRVLNIGPVPLNVLEQTIDDWIQESTSSTSSHVHVHQYLPVVMLTAFYFQAFFE